MTARRAVLVLVCAAWMITIGGAGLYLVLRSDYPLGDKALQLPLLTVNLVLGFALARVGRLARAEVAARALSPQRRGVAGGARGAAASSRRAGGKGRRPR